MNRETRANLILIVVVLAVLIPGAVIVVRKKYDPAIKPMGRPDGVRRHMVFIDPTPAPPGMRRMMPAVTAAWVNDLSLSRLGVPMRREVLDAEPTPPSATGNPGAVAADAAGRPIMSSDRLAQLVAVRMIGEESMDLGLLVWNLPRGTERAGLQVKVGPLGWSGADAPEPEALLVTTELIPVPPEVKKDLEYSGLPAPPQQVLWGVARVAPPPGRELGNEPLTLAITCVAGGRTFNDTLTFVPHPAARPAAVAD